MPLRSTPFKIYEKEFWRRKWLRFKYDHVKENLRRYILVSELATAVSSTTLAYIGVISLAIAFASIGLILIHRLRDWRIELVIEEASDRGAGKAAKNLNSALRSHNLEPDSSRRW